jgi:hypothetical protein
MSTFCSRLLLGFVAVCMLVSCGGHHGDPPAVASSAVLRGQEEVSPVASNAFGSAVVTVDLNNSTMIASVITSGIAATDAHIHFGLPGTSGPIVFPLTRVTGTMIWTTSVVIDESQLATLEAGNYYVDVHSAAFPNGEIRGQIFPDFPSRGQVNLMQQVAAQSPLVQRQLLQLQDIIDWHNHRGFAIIGFSIGF